MKIFRAEIDATSITSSMKFVDPAAALDQGEVGADV
jgi:hypothetical protein